MDIIFHFAYNPFSLSMVLSLLIVIFLFTHILIPFFFLHFFLGKKMGRWFPFRGPGQVLHHRLMFRRIDFVIACTLMD